MPLHYILFWISEIIPRYRNEMNGIDMYSFPEKQQDTLYEIYAMLRATGMDPGRLEDNIWYFSDDACRLHLLLTEYARDIDQATTGLQTVIADRFL
jgi:hypothetical protein